MTPDGPEETAYRDGCRTARGIVNGALVMLAVAIVAVLIWCNCGCTAPPYAGERYPYTGPILNTNGVPFVPED